jgi:hypothetical protein
MSHFMEILLSPSCLGDNTPKGQAMMHIQQPTHFLGLVSLETIPVAESFRIAPVMQALTQTGSSQCLQTRGTGLFSTTWR